MEKCEGEKCEHSKHADDHLKKVQPKTDVHWCKCVCMYCFFHLMCGFAYYKATSTLQYSH